MKTLRLVCFILLFFTLAALELTVQVVVALLTLRSDPTKRRQHELAAFAFRLLLMSSPGWTLEIEGEDQIGPGPYVFVANHQSLADIVILHRLQHYFKWVSKESIFFVPFMGWSMKLKGDIAIKRGDMVSTRRMMHECQSWLKRGVSIMLFPEGTRSPDGELRDFRIGSFKLAHLIGVDIVPIAIDGTHEVLPKGTTALNYSGSMRIRVLPPIVVTPSSTPEQLRQQAQLEISQALDEMRNRTRPPAQRVA